MDKCWILRTTTWLGCAAVLLLSSGAEAAIGLFNTGVDSANAALSVSKSSTVYADSHYLVFDPWFGTNPPRAPYAVAGAIDCSGSSCIDPGWLSPSSASNWIAMQSNWDSASETWRTQYNSDISSPLIGTYTTSFDLTGIIYSATSIAGNVAASTRLVDILLNGQRTGHDWNSATSWDTFSLTSGFQAGINTLTFEVENTGIPSGLRVEYTSIVAPPVPEPETYAMILAGLGIMGCVARRRARLRNARPS
jgi:hypothetical protein